jgi:hypothetical protein
MDKKQRLEHARKLGILVDKQDKWMLEDYLWHIRPSDGHVVTLMPVEKGAIEVRLDHCVMGLYELKRHQ